MSLSIDNQSQNKQILPRLGSLDLNKPVKFKNPVNEKESKIIFKVTNYNDNTLRVYITPINQDVIKLSFPSEELVSISDIINL